MKNFKLNAHGLKNSCDQYRNINGVEFICASPANHEEVKAEALKQGKKARIIKGQIFVEKGFKFN